MIYLQASPEGATYEKSLDLIGLIFKGGWVMIPLLLLSILTIVIVIERYLFLGKQGVGKKNNFENFLAALKVGNNTEAARLCEEDNAAWSRIFQYAALTEISGDEQEKLMDQAANVEVAYLERRLNVLSIVAGVAPLLGFIGTIAGVITIFFDISTTADISIGVISEGLYQKMVSSAGGLVVGIIAFVFYQLLQNSVDKFVAQMEEYSLQLKTLFLQGK
ncbi:MAG: MotA/TolQ/ExbB proton channel family protein [Sediminibacterium sp.]